MEQTTVTETAVKDNPAKEISLETNQNALDDLLNSMEQASGDIQRDKGTRFETLIRDWLTKEPAYKDLYEKVLTYRDWAEAYPDFSRSKKKDIGIDLVAVNADGKGFTAIQCKFYGKHERVGKAGIDSFISASEQPFFTSRLLVATNEDWTDNVTEELRNKQPPITLITRETLAKSTVDWSAYRKGDLREIAKRTPREYQKDAIKDVVRGFRTADRGKLIMACGTGKTYTSLKIAEDEEIAGKGGFVLFLVPSLSLLSQTLTDWKQQCQYPIKAFAVCSDSSTGKADMEDPDSLTVGSELAYPATTNAVQLAEQVKNALSDREAMTVVFSTYQSIDVIHQAQPLIKVVPESKPDEPGTQEGLFSNESQPGLFDEQSREQSEKLEEKPFDLIICDEAHRTAGGHMADEEDAVFTRVHDNGYVKARKRLYMTATPRIYGQAAKKQKEDEEIVLYSMDDEGIFGREFHHISFTKAVELKSLVDYKVIVFTVNESLIGDKDDPKDLYYGSQGGLSVSNAAKVIGCWKALSKCDLQAEQSLGDDLKAMKRAVGFAQVIEPTKSYNKTSSKAFTSEFNKVIDHYRQRLRQGIEDAGAVIDEKEYGLVCDTRHIDGSMNATEKAERLNWLRAEPEENHCKILFNVRCLSEGVDVPALDAVIFLSPRQSQVDVVQTVGRVMRTSKATNKKRGYVIIPVVTPPGIPADSVLDNNKAYDAVWQILKALKSIDEEFGSIVDGKLKIVDSNRIEVVCITDRKLARRLPRSTDNKPSRRSKGDNDGDNGERGTQLTTLSGFGRDEILEEAIRARIVKKVGNRREWEEWAENVGDICKKQIEHIKAVLNNPDNKKSRKAFESFWEELKSTLNGDLTEGEVLEMLGQHIVTKPVMDALFSDYSFTERNPVSKAMTHMLNALDKEGMKSATRLLEEFYQSVKRRAKHIRTAEDRQTVILELFDKFFKFAFPKMRDKLGIVYTPVPVVDFINQSVADVLQKEFKTTLASPSVHILDPFVGTGTFLTRLLQSGLIPSDQLEQKFMNGIHAFEIVPLAYYVASLNLESTLHDLLPGLEYQPNPVMVWTDTFADHKPNPLFKTSLMENDERWKNAKKLDIRVIIGNPPYSVGQESQTDNNENTHYARLDSRIEKTYASKTNASLKGKLYDSYIRAYRWASDRIKDKGVIGFVTNAGWIESPSANGMRKCMAEEFNSIYVFHLKGNARTQGERRRKERDNVFGEGSRAPVAIVVLVKNPDDPVRGKIYFHAVGDYLTREEKLKQISGYRSVSNIPWQRIVPDAHGDWLNQRDDSFSEFIRLAFPKKYKTLKKLASQKEQVFSFFAIGVSTNKDPWAYNSSKNEVGNSVKRLIAGYKEANNLKNQNKSGTDIYSRIRLPWSRLLKNKLDKKAEINFSDRKLRTSVYRPFIKQWLYYDKTEGVIERPGLWDTIFPTPKTSNRVICANQGAKASDGFIALMSDSISDLHFNGDSQCFPLYVYRKLEQEEKSGIDSELGLDNPNELKESRVVVDGFAREDAITDGALRHFQSVYEETIAKDDLFYYIYGILHSSDYRTKYANNLMRELPRIPRVATFEQFKAFSEAGRKLADLHVNFEKQTPYAGVTVNKKEGASYKITQMRWGKVPGKTGNAAKDKTRLIYNEGITIENIPIEAQEYVVNKKSALDWLVERCCVSTDKDSGIANDFNKYGEEQGDKKYPYDLFLKIITVSLETMRIVRALPKLEIHPLDKMQ